MSETVQDLLGKTRPSPSLFLQLLAKWKKEAAVLLAMVLVLATPFFLRPAVSTSPSRFTKKLIIMTPHHERIRQEFGQGFARYWKVKTGEVLYIDWRVAGSAELATLVKSDFNSAFERIWKLDKGQPWSAEVAHAFRDSTSASPARTAFMESNTSIGIDVLFGGGAYDFNQAAAAGYLVGKEAKSGAGLSRIRDKHPEWFGEKGIPQVLSGQTFWDKELRWCGTCLSSFGIVYNKDALVRLGIKAPPTQWEDLADPRYAGQIALADPTKSGSVMMAFEMLVQQQIHKSLAALTASPGRLRNAAEIENAAVRQGWITGLQLIQKISANARYFTHSASKIPMEVSRGDAAAGMCIDFYGRTAEEDVRQPDGYSRVGFTIPVGGTAISVDAIGMFRGAPQPELAEAFIEWTLSDEGQRLWSFRKGAVGAPQNLALRRLPVRKDFYSTENRQWMSDAASDPWKAAEAFIYKPEWTGAAFGPLRFLIRVACIDTHAELKSAWKATIRAGMPPRALEILSQMTAASYDTATRSVAAMLKDKNKTQEVRAARHLNEAFTRQYQQAANIAKEAARRRP